MAFEFCSNESLATGLRRVMRERLDKALAALDDATPEQLAEVVHGSRKEFKRLRALLRLARPALGRKRFAHENRVLREAGRALSAVRDSQVLGTAFTQLLETAPGRIPAATVAGVRRGLTRHVEAVKRVTALEERVPPVLADLRHLRERMPRWSLSSAAADDNADAADWEPAIGAGLCQSYRQARLALALVEKEGGTLDAPWHELRKRVKDVGYQLRLFRPVWRRELKARVRALDAVAAALGDDHDLLVLRDLLQMPKEPWAAPEELHGVTALIEERRAKLQRKALKNARRLFLEKPARFTAQLCGYWQIWQGGKVESKTSP